MKYLPRFRTQFLISVFAVLAAVPLVGQAGSPPQQPIAPSKADPYAALTAVGMLPVKTNDQDATIQIIVSKSVVPAIQQLDFPPRLVIDLPKTRVAIKRKQIPIDHLQVNAIRIDQFQANPPVARVVVDLDVPRGYSWNAVGNRLLVHLKDPTNSASAGAEPASVVGFSSGKPAAVVPVTPAGNGALVEAGSRVSAGSTITAGEDTTILRIARGGEIRVCPGTTASVTASESGRDLMLSMSTGSVEVHYTSNASEDSILTPDFRILLPGPGEFNYAVSTDTRGNTCVRALRGNTASVTISELMGDRTYRLKPTDELMFHSGRLDTVDSSIPPHCGCPPPRPEVLRASDTEAPVIPDTNVPNAMRLAQPGDPKHGMSPVDPASALAPSSPPPAGVAVSIAAPETAPLPPPQPDEVQVKVEAPLVYRGGDPPPAPTQEARRLPLITLPAEPKFQTMVLSPPTRQTHHPKPPRRGFFGRVKGLFSAMFS